MKMKSTLAKAAAVAGGCLFAVLLAEGAMRLKGFSFPLMLEKVQFGYPTPVVMKDLFVFDKDVFWLPKNYSARLVTADGTDPVIVYMGDSCTEWGLYEKYMSLIVKTNHPGIPFSYLNLGVGGWSSYQGLQQLKRDILPLRPKIVTLFFGWNDHWVGFGIQDKDITKINSSLYVHLRKFRVAQLLTKTYVALHYRANQQRVTADDFRQNLTTMVRLAKKNGIVPILITAPTSHERGKEPGYLTGRHLTRLEDLIPLHQRYVSIVRDVARENDVVLADMAQEFARLPQDSLSTAYFHNDGIHLTDLGHRRFAGLLYTCFERSNLFSKLAVPAHP